MKGKFLPKIFSSSVQILKTDSTSTVFRVVGVPYGGPDYLQGKDLHGEFFSRNTDYGRKADGSFKVTQLLSFYDHALNPNIGDDPIGDAKFFAESDMGQVWDIEVMRAYRYHDMLLQMAEKNLLGASSQPVQTAVEINGNTGEIKKWYLAEISLTPTPANPLAVAEVLKSFNIEVKEAELENEDTTNVENGAEVTEPETDLEQEIEQEFEQAETETLGEIKALLVELKAVVDAVVTAQTSEKETSKELLKEIGAVKAGVKTFASNVAKRLNIRIQDVAKDLEMRSNAEIEADGADPKKNTDEEEETPRPVVVKSRVPAGAPGTKK